jgi:hypothetical protein
MMLAATNRDDNPKYEFRNVEQKTQQIKQLTEHLLKKYALSDIVVTDHWDVDNTAIGLANKSKEYTVYITDNGRTDNKFLFHYNILRQLMTFHTYLEETLTIYPLKKLKTFSSSIQKLGNDS